MSKLERTKSLTTNLLPIRSSTRKREKKEEIVIASAVNTRDMNNNNTSSNNGRAPGNVINSNNSGKNNINNNNNVSNNSSNLITSRRMSSNSNQEQLALNTNNNSQILKKQQQLVKSSTSKKFLTSNRVKMIEELETLSDLKQSNKLKLPSFYCVNINQDGFRNMDRASHINDENIDESQMVSSMEFKLRPISGLRNHLKRNLSTSFNSLDVMKETDLVERISFLRASLKRLDLSYNNLKAYPRQLCDLHLLECLNLTGNYLTETDFPVEMDRYQGLIELVLDSNCLKHVPKPIVKCRRLSRLSMKNNSLVDLKNIEQFRKLKILILDGNSLTQLDETIKTLEKLEYLFASENNLQSIQFSVFKTHLSALRHLDLSSNKLQVVTYDLFMMPHLEILNLSNNQLSKLPQIPGTHLRSVPIFSLDLSSNQLNKFYEYLIQLAVNVDMSSNKIKILPKKFLSRLGEAELSAKTLKLDDNPLLDPPMDVCRYGLKSIKEYFDEESRHVQLNKGFKIVLMGDTRSGKTLLANVLEDYSMASSTNPAEMYFDVDTVNVTAESKFVETHEFFINTTENNKTEQKPIAEGQTIKKSESTNNLTHRDSVTVEQHSRTVRIDSRATSVDSKRLPSSKTSNRAKKSRSHLKNELNAFSNQKLLQQNVKNLDPILFKTDDNNTINNSNTNITQVPKKTIVPVSVYDFNGSIRQYAHLIDVFMDKNALILLCIEAVGFNEMLINRQAEHSVAYEKTLNDLLDVLFLKMSKAVTFLILPVLTKIDRLNTTNVNVKSLCVEVENFLKANLNAKLDDVKKDLRKIEQLSHITASQSDKLKQLALTQSNLNPDIYRQCIPVSSLKLDGIEQLLASINEIVSLYKKYFPDVNKKLPVFWNEVEAYTVNVLGTGVVQQPRNLDNERSTGRSGSFKPLSVSTVAQTIPMVSIDYDEYREKVVDKYGMSHLIEQITKYLHNTGKIIWLSQSERLKRKVFLRPAVLFDLMYVLYRKNFKDNFTDPYVQATRNKLMSANDELINQHAQNLFSHGILSFELLKLVWCPVLMTTNVKYIKDVFMLFVDFFHIAYPSMPKDRFKQLYHSYAKKKQLEPVETEFLLEQFNSFVLPFYLPYLNDDKLISRTRAKLVADSNRAVRKVVDLNIKKSQPRLVCRIAQKYSFPWGLLPGVFEKFTVNCFINSDLYYVSHYRNFIHACNEENTIGVIIYTDLTKESTRCNEVVFEFYLTSYEQIIESIQESNKLMDANFEQTSSMDLDHLWVLALRVLELFEESIACNYPSLRFDRLSLCPECEKFTFFGEWSTPKELQKLKSRTCIDCQQTVEYSYLVKPISGQNLALDMKKMHQRLENITRMRTNTSLSKSDY